MNFFSVIIATVLLASTNVAVAQGVPVAGTHFREFVAGQSTPRPGRLEVIEFFMYSCVHCAAFNKESEAWSKNLPKNIVFTRMPVAFSDSKLPHSRMYFALKAMGKQDELHHEIFSAIHDENKNLLVPGEQADYLRSLALIAPSIWRTINHSRCKPPRRGPLLSFASTSLMRCLQYLSMAVMSRPLGWRAAQVKCCAWPTTCST